MTNKKQFYPIENRQRRRWELVFYLRIFDQKDNSLLGHVIDISEDGLMLLTESPIELNKDYDLILEMPATGDDEREKITFRAHSLWQSSDANPDLIDTGFQLVDPDKESIYAIKTLIDELQF